MKESTRHYFANRLGFARRLVIKGIKIFERDFVMKNPYTGLPFKLNSYKHKGYWYFGAGREEETIQSLRKIVKKNDLVIEAGGHIGFITHLYSDLVGDKGMVKVFEPGENNLSYAKFNVSSLNNTELLEEGCSDENGEVSFFMDSLSGQNNSLLSDYKGASKVAESQYTSVNITEIKIKVVKLSDYIDSLKRVPSHVKIDVEGAELAVLHGMGEYLGKVPSLMVEITHDQEEIFTLLHEKGYDTYSVDLSQRINTVNGNMFCLLKDEPVQ